MSCSVFQCKNRFVKGGLIHFYSFPPKKDVERRKKWIAAVKRKDFDDVDNHRICSVHFHSGKFLRCLHDFFITPL